MYKMFVSEHLLNDINEIFKFAYVEFNETCELLSESCLDESISESQN